ncbi:MAG: hypothetical protein Q9163_002040 [Psora crenata]
MEDSSVEHGIELYPKNRDGGEYLSVNTGQGSINPHQNDQELVNHSLSTKKRRVIKAPRDPTAALLKYSTSHYVPYNPARNNVGSHVSTKFTKFSQYDGYSLFMDPGLTDIHQIPRPGVRLDDSTVAKVMIKYGRKTLHNNWPAEFDVAGMVRATRVPLGYAAKKWVKKGDTDVDGNIVAPDKEGYYYLWWRGIHCLMGKEGLDAGLYMIRPSFEEFKCQGLSFKVTHRAAIQLASGNPHDPTFTTPGHHSEPSST